MSGSSRYVIAKCGLGKSCKKCGSIDDPIVVNKGPHYTLYCASCGSYFKHASVEDKNNMYVKHVKVEDLTPVKVCMLYVDSQKTMTTKR